MTPIVFDRIFRRLVVRDARIINEANTLGEAFGIDNAIEAWEFAVEMLANWDRFANALHKIATEQNMYRKKESRDVTYMPSALAKMLAQIGAVTIVEDPNGPQG